MEIELTNKHIPLVEETTDFCVNVWQATCLENWRGLDQIWRAITSIRANLIEGESQRDIQYSPRQLLGKAYGSLHEVAHWLWWAKLEGKITSELYIKLDTQAKELSGKLAGHINNVPLPPKSRQEQKQAIEDTYQKFMRGRKNKT